MTKNDQQLSSVVARTVMVSVVFLLLFVFGWKFTIETITASAKLLDVEWMPWTIILVRWGIAVVLGLIMLTLTAVILKTLIAVLQIQGYLKSRGTEEAKTSKVRAWSAYDSIGRWTKNGGVAIVCLIIVLGILVVINSQYDPMRYI